VSCSELMVISTRKLTQDSLLSLISHLNPRLAAYLEGAEARQKALDEKQRKKYAKLERILGRAPKSSSDFETAATRLADAGEELERDENSNGSGEEEGEEKVAESSAAGAKRNAAASSSKSTSNSTSKGEDQVVGQKRKERFDDHEFVEQSREIVDNVRSAVASGESLKQDTKELSNLSMGQNPILS
jgi:HD-GYP domain-containing protein (c-di-GMP phosphodiesterase class II)